MRIPIKPVILIFYAIMILAACLRAEAFIDDFSAAPQTGVAEDMTAAAPELAPPIQQKIEEEFPGGGQAEENTASPRLLFDIMEAKREAFGQILDDPKRYEVQILLTKIDRDPSGQLSFIDYEYGVDAKKYFYPASVIKLAIAALTLQKINTLEGAARNCKLNTAQYQSSTIEVSIKDMIVDSDNDSYNKLYDFLGQEYINETLHSMGYYDVQVVRRFNSPTSVAADRVNYAWELRDSGGAFICKQPSLTNKNIYSLKDRKDMTGLVRGKAYYTSGFRVAGPKEFYDYNYMSIDVMQRILKAIVFPQSVEEKARFAIFEEDREFLLKCMLGETTENKYFIHGGTGQAYPYIEIYNKVGMAYGNLIDNAYIRDAKNNIEFMLTAVIYTNYDEVLGDDDYEYDEIGKPFLKELGLAVYEYFLEEKYAGKKQLLQPRETTDP